MSGNFDGPDCGIDGCAREVGHIGDHRRDPLAVRTAGDLLAAAARVAPEAYEAFARAIAEADPGLGADFAWAVSHPDE